MGIYVKNEQKKKRRGQYFLCETCGKEFYVYPSYIRKANKLGSTIRYCSMACYDKTGENNPFHGKRHSKESKKMMSQSPTRSRFGVGEDNPNFVRYGEEYGFKGSRASWWRRKLMKEIGRCEHCGTDDKRVLTMHHIDRNRSNNERENLLLLCWNCHAIVHYEEKTGFYHFRK